MVLILFLIDTSASMNQRTGLGTTYLDIAKGAVESFMKVGPQFFFDSFRPPSAIRFSREASDV